MKYKIHISVEIWGKTFQNTEHVCFSSQKSKSHSLSFSSTFFQNNRRERRRHRFLSGEQCYATHFSIQKTFKGRLTTSAGAPEGLTIGLFQSPSGLKDSTTVLVAVIALVTSTGPSSGGEQQYRPLHSITRRWCCEHEPWWIIDQHGVNVSLYCIGVCVNCAWR